MEIKNKSNAQLVYNHLRKEPDIHYNLVIAMIANSAVETGGTLDFKTKQKGRKDPAYGLFQFDPRGASLYSLYLEYLDYARTTDSAEAQLNMLVDIVLGVWKAGVSHVGLGNVRKVTLAAEMSAESATKAFSDHILRPGKPHMDRRLTACAEALKLFPLTGEAE